MSTLSGKDISYFYPYDGLILNLKQIDEIKSSIEGGKQVEGLRT